jgi:HEAT repeat protein
MSLELLKQQLVGEKGDARETARSLGEVAVPVLVEYARGEAPGVRALALECLAGIGGDRAVGALVAALDDESLNVRNRALRLLEKTHSPAAAPRLTELVSASPHARVRGGAALVLGRMNVASSLPAIRKQMGGEADPAAARQMLLACARLGDEPARLRVLARLQDAEARNRYEALGDVEYVADRALLGKFRPLLQDEEAVVNVGTEPFPAWHRVCDRAVEAAVGLLGRPLSFPTGARVYSAEQIREARKAIDEAVRTK